MNAIIPRGFIFNIVCSNFDPIMIREETYDISVRYFYLIIDQLMSNNYVCVPSAILLDQVEIIYFVEYLYYFIFEFVKPSSFNFKANLNECFKSWIFTLSHDLVQICIKKEANCIDLLNYSSNKEGMGGKRVEQFVSSWVTRAQEWAWTKQND